MQKKRPKINKLPRCRRQRHAGVPYGSGTHFGGLRPGSVALPGFRRILRAPFRGPPDGAVCFGVAVAQSRQAASIRIVAAWAFRYYRQILSTNNSLREVFSRCKITAIVKRRQLPEVGIVGRDTSYKLGSGWSGHKKMGKLTISRRYDPIPLLRSRPGGFSGSWPYRTYPAAKVLLFVNVAKSWAHIY